ncbi:hypothetical protein BIW11_09184 [Tropilaelaps mercedesae]|uniref:Uncharacterized protein n=1 Tax=Tropilaelaps mercedesae TaxID=418985 RepID=A0A1V9XL56_9ACAR|nr:hypothetical protein BIW11_09184 [Tropilaelaps mercedesae]
MDHIDDDRCPLSLSEQTCESSSKISTIFTKSPSYRSKAYIQRQNGTARSIANHGCPQNLVPLDLAWSPSSQTDPCGCLNNDQSSGSATSSCFRPPVARQRRSQSVPLVRFKLRLGNDTLAGAGGETSPPALLHNRPPIYENFACENGVEQHRKGLLPESEVSEFIQPSSRDQDSQTDVVISLDDSLLPYGRMPRVDLSTQTSSEPRDAVSIATSTNSLRKSDRFPLYQRKLISCGLSETFSTNILHPHRAFKQYPGFSRDELLALQCVLYIWGVLLVSVGIIFYSVI